MDERRLRRAIVGLAAFTLLIPATSQDVLGQEAKTFDPGIVTGPTWSLSGELGSYGEWYDMAGRDSRRPGSSGRLFLRPTFSALGRYTVAFDVLLSTEGNSALARQSLNRYTVRPTWSWGSAQLGDFSDTYSAYTFSGIQVRGASVAADRGGYRISALGGRSQRTIEGEADGGSFQQTMFAGKIGMGTHSTSTLDVIVLSAMDDINSREALADTLLPPDSTQVGSPTNPYSVTPQKNLVVSAIGSTRLLSNRLELTGEFGRSEYTRDRRAAESVSGRNGFLYRSGISFTQSRFTVAGGYRQVDPGYVSLGVASLRSDQREVLVQSSYRLARANISLDVARQNDNLERNKAFTTTRYLYRATGGWQPLRSWNASLFGNYLTMANHAASDSLLIDYRVLVLGTGQTVLLSPTGILQSASLTYSFQRSVDDNPLRSDANSRSQNASLTLSMRPSKTITLTPSASFVGARTGGQGWMRTGTYAIAGHHLAMRNRLTTSLSVGISSVRDATSYRSALTTKYRLTQADAIQLGIRATNFRDSGSDASIGGDFDEFVATMDWKRRF